VSWQAAAAAWHDLASRLADQLAWLDEAERGLADCWKGEAAETARATLADLRERTAALRLPAVRTAALLDAHARAVTRIPFAVSPLAALALAAVSDVRTAAEIASLVIPQGSPSAIHLWWSRLPAAERDRLVYTAPERIGWLDGIPAVDRDRANRLVLARSSNPSLAQLRTRLTDGVYLMGLDTRGDGRAIVAYGDPDQARNVLTFVPGMTAGLNGTLGTNLDRTRAMATAAAQADPSASTSAVLWIGYDAPDTVIEAARSAYADAARADLHSFQEGLAVTHNGEIGEQSVVGYSYGALVVGETARDVGMRADDLVFLGAAGVGAGSAADLNVDPATVWAASADNDIVGLAAPSLRQLLMEPYNSRYFGSPMADLWHGHNPAEAGFGGHVFAAADRDNPITAHLSYWDSGNPALAAVGRIATGTPTPP
jgi:hypothetical protein